MAMAVHLNMCSSPVCETVVQTSEMMIHLTTSQLQSSHEMSISNMSSQQQIEYKKIGCCNCFLEAKCPIFHLYFNLQYIKWGIISFRRHKSCSECAYFYHGRCFGRRVTLIQYIGTRFLHNEFLQWADLQFSPAGSNLDPPWCWVLYLI